jgi:glycosyltransferase involved in cell wall biosynthesis
VRAFYYVPAPGKRAALYRDWVVMLLCRPFFRDFVHHWHAVGLGDWLKRDGSWLERWLTHRLLGRPALGVALAIPSMRDALWFRSQDVKIVPNGIPDPCPDFDEAILPRRRARLQARRRMLAGEALTGREVGAAQDDPETFHVLFLAHCTREKGLFDTLEAIALANGQLLAARSPFRCRLTVAGAFPREDEQAEFQRRVAQSDLAGAVHYAGFVDGVAKNALLCDSDCLCFPTFYHAESFGLVVVEAMAAGLSVITTRWRALPELLPTDYPGFVPIADPAAVAQALISAFQWEATELRATFLARFTERAHAARLAEALRSLTAKECAA